MTDAAAYEEEEEEETATTAKATAAVAVDSANDTKNELDEARTDGDKNDDDRGSTAALASSTGDSDATHERDAKRRRLDGEEIDDEDKGIGGGGRGGGTTSTKMGPPPSAGTLALMRRINVHALRFDEWRARYPRDAATNPAGYFEYLLTWQRRREESLAEFCIDHEWFVDKYDPERRRAAVEMCHARAAAASVLADLGGKVLLVCERAPARTSRADIATAVAAGSDSSVRALLGDVVYARADDISRRLVLAFDDENDPVYVRLREQRQLYLPARGREPEALLELVTRPPPSPRVVPASWAAEPARVHADVTRALLLARRLDTIAKVPDADNVDAALRLFPETPAPSEGDSAATADLARLDATLAYLRRVHLVCYYSALRFSSLEAMLAHPGCATGEVRGDAAVADLLLGPRVLDAWVDALTEELSEQRVALTEKAEEELLTRARADRRRAADEFLATKYREGANAKGQTSFACLMPDCTKVFLEAQYVMKHLVNIHAETIKPELAARESAALRPTLLRAFRNDPRRVRPTVPRFIEMVLAHGPSWRPPMPFSRVVPPTAMQSSRTAAPLPPPPALLVRPTAPQERIRYRDPDAPPPERQGAAPKLAYRTKVSYEDAL